MKIFGDQPNISAIHNDCNKSSNVLAAAQKRRIGKLGENASCKFLKSAGWNIEERNYRLGKHEIDIIASNDRYIVFAEVKTRSPSEYGNPSAAVTKKKRASVIAAARGYLKTNFYDLYPRFDVIEVYTDESGKHVTAVNRIENAFDSDGLTII